MYAEPEDGYWPALLASVLIASAITWYFATFLAAVVTAIGAFTVGGFLLQRLGLNIFGRERTVEHERKSSYHTCISCGEPAKVVPGTP